MHKNATDFVIDRNAIANIMYVMYDYNSL